MVHYYDLSLKNTLIFLASLHLETPLYLSGKTPILVKSC